MQDTMKALEVIGRTILVAINVLLAVLVAILGSGQTSGRKRKARQTHQTHTANYRTVRGFRKTNGYWKAEGRMSGQTHERYRHGR